jgi:PucR-like helix-turn-helix protein/diguanylate cyclase with GGDEF domain
MRRARSFENDQQSAAGRGADLSAPRTTPLTLVAGAVAGDDLQSIATSVAEALHCSVAIAIPALGDPVVSPPGSLDQKVAIAIVDHATAVIGAQAGSAPDVIAEAVTVQIADQVVGIVAAVAAAKPPAGTTTAERRAWLEAAAAAASVTALIREGHDSSSVAAAADVLAELTAGTPDDLPGFLARARRLGVELSAGGLVLCAKHRAANGSPPRSDDVDEALIGELRSSYTRLIAPRADGRILALVGLAADGGAGSALELARRLDNAGWSVSLSAPRRDPALLHQAVQEAELLAELRVDDSPPSGQDETYRLLIGVLLRDRDELQQLRDRTVSALAEYDERHDTELLATLKAFLSHDGSTTETAEVMALHRHTVGYRLSRVHEVSGLSPYESDGRERLSLGIKAQQILDAERRWGRSH